MINEETRRKLREINLGEAIKGLEVQQADPATIALPFDERMQRLVDYIYQEKYNGKIQRLIKSAKLRFPQANRQGVIYASRGLNRELIENLFSGQYIGLHQSIMSIETHACLSGDYEKTMREIEEAAAAWREEQKALRRARREAKSGTGKDCSNADGAKDA